MHVTSSSLTWCRTECGRGTTVAFAGVGGRSITGVSGVGPRRAMCGSDGRVGPEKRGALCLACG